MDDSIFSEEIYSQLCEEYGTEFPQDYLDYLKGYSGEPPEDLFFWVIPNDWGSGMSEVFTMSGDPETSLPQFLQKDVMPFKPGLLPIGSDESFGYILLSLRPDDYGSIHFCCDWSDDGKVDFYESRGYWKIADSFSGFLDSLIEPPEED